MEQAPKAEGKQKRVVTAVGPEPQGVSQLMVACLEEQIAVK